MIAEGIRRAGNGDSERLREAVEDIKGFEGMQGTYDLSPIDHYGTRIEQMVLLTVRDGAWRFAKAFSTMLLFEDFHGNRKGSLIRRLAEFLPEAGVGDDPRIKDDLE